MRFHREKVDRRFHYFSIIVALDAKVAAFDRDFQIIEMLSAIMATNDKWLKVDRAEKSTVLSCGLNTLDQDLGAFVKVLVIWVEPQMIAVDHLNYGLRLVFVELFRSIVTWPLRCVLNDNVSGPRINVFNSEYEIQGPKIDWVYFFFRHCHHGEKGIRGTYKFAGSHAEESKEHGQDYKGEKCANPGLKGSFLLVSQLYILPKNVKRFQLR